MGSKTLENARATSKHIWQITSLQKIFNYFIKSFAGCLVINLVIVQFHSNLFCFSTMLQKAWLSFCVLKKRQMHVDPCGSKTGKSSTLKFSALWVSRRDSCKGFPRSSWYNSFLPFRLLKLRKVKEITIRCPRECKSFLKDERTQKSISSLNRCNNAS